jgi:ATP-binding cassette subfamily B protein
VPIVSPTHPDGDDHTEPLTIDSPYDAPPAPLDPDPDKGWLRRLAPLLAHHRVVIAASVIAAIAAMGSQIFVPQVIRLAIDRSFPSTDGAESAQLDALWPYVLILVGLGVGRGLFTFLYRYGLYSMAFKMEFHLRTLLFNHLGRMSFAFFDRVQSGQIISRANSDIRSVQMFLAFAPIMTVQFFSFLLAVVFMVQIDLVLTAVTMIALPGVLLIGQRLRLIMFPLSWIQQSRMAEVATVVDENVTGVRVVKAFAAEQRQIEELAYAAERLRWANLQAHFSRARFTPFIENLPRFALAFVLLYGGLQAIDGDLTVGDLIAFNLYIVLLQAPFRFLGMLLILGQRAKASAQRIYEILDEQPTVLDVPNAVSIQAPAGEVSFDQVQFAYGTETVGGSAGAEVTTAVLSGFDLHIPAGQTIAIVGRTGSGKSTIPRLLLRFYEPSSGTISIDEHDIATVTTTSLRNAISLVPDEPFLFSTTVHDNIAYARPDATRAEVEAAARKAQAHDFISSMEDGYDTVVGERGYDLSGGQRQRIAIARAFIADPAILILDDSTSSIDVHVEELIHNGLIDVMANRTTIIIAHRLSTIGLAERVVFIEHGRIVADGTHSHLLATEPRYMEALAASEEESPIPDNPIPDDLVPGSPVSETGAGANSWP